MALTEKRIRDMKPDAKRRIAWHDQVRGLGVRMTPAGVKSFILNYRVHGRERRMTLGRVSELSLSKARTRAGEELELVRKGVDPLAQKEARRDAPTMAQLFERYMSDYARPHKKPRSVEEDERLIRLHLDPAFGWRKVAELTRRNRPLAQIHEGEGGAANRSRSLFSKMMNLAEVWDWRPDGSNPVRHIKLFRELWGGG